ncbi:mel-26 [Symbiodinium sp. CCMP2456]|nr:mel-26 [Symbiodinium sp. CCMP2456]
MVEVAAIADKYQVEALPPLCLHLVRKALKPDVACEVFGLADRFHVAEMRAEALDCIFAKPAEALKERPALRPELLEEILGSGLLCTKTDALKKTVQSWGGKDCDSLASIINIPANNEYTDDVLDRLMGKWRDADRKGAFVGYWVAVIVGPGQDKYTADQLERVAGNQGKFSLRKGWMQWVLHHASVHLQGFWFSTTVPASTSFRINVKSDEDGATWHLAYESRGKEIEDYTFQTCSRPLGLVKHFKLEVLEGELPETHFDIEGILQTPI